MNTSNHSCICKWRLYVRVSEIALNCRREDDFLDEGVDDLVAALVFLEFDFGLGGFEELHGAVGDDIYLAIAILPTRRKNCCDPT